MKIPWCFPKQCWPWLIALTGLVGGASSLKAQVNLTVQPVTYPSGLTKNVGAGSTIVTSGSVVVSSGSNITFQAGTSISLEPGFTASSGSYFHTILAPGGDLVAPSTPSNVRTTTISGTSVSLAWDASSDNVGVAGYKIYRGSVEIGTTTGLTFTDSFLSLTTTYSYTVKAYDAVSNFSNASAPPLSVTTTGGATIDTTGIGLKVHRPAQ